MIVGIKKKKNIIVLSLCMVISFILYQLYFFSTISSVKVNNNRIVSVLDHTDMKQLKHLRSEADKNINENGVIRGILYTNILRYRPDFKNEFNCLNSEQSIPFEYVNDDYCDCGDATDEPSTSACVNGTFYCDTQYKNKLVSFNSVPSSKVNDGICDCCDGSDEWLYGPNEKVLSQKSTKLNKCLNICNR